MKEFKKLCLSIAAFSLFSFVTLNAADVAYRGGGAREGGERDYGHYEGYHGDNRNRGAYDAYENSGGVIAPGYGYGGYGYPAGGYLLPGPVDPGEDEADAIYRVNQHRGPL